MSPLPSIWQITNTSLSGVERLETSCGIISLTWNSHPSLHFGYNFTSLIVLKRLSWGFQYPYPVGCHTGPCFRSSSLYFIYRRVPTLLLSFINFQLQVTFLLMTFKHTCTSMVHPLVKYYWLTKLTKRSSSLVVLK